MPVRLERILDGALKIHPGEGRRVLFMALYSASAIGALVVGRTVRDALFLADRSTSDLPLMYVVNALAVALLSWGYAKYADTIRRDTLNALTALGWALVMSALFFAAVAAPKGTAPVLYVAVEAMGALMVLQFWTFAQDVFNTREAKRLFGLIGAGGTAANVLHGFVSAAIAKRFGSEPLLLFCAANLVACAALAWYIGNRHGAATPSPSALAQQRSRLPSRKQGKGERHGRHGSLRSLMTPHLITVAGITVLCTIAVHLVDFQFKVAAEQNIGDSRELGAFFGQFYGFAGILALGIQLGLTGRVLERFGILASLLPLPIGLALGSITGFHFPGVWTASLAKGADTVLRFTINDTSMQLLYVPVPAHERGRAKAIIDGMLRPAASVLTGLVLLWLAFLLPSTNLGAGGVITSLIVCVVVLWMLLLIRGRREYMRSLLDTLRRRRLDLRDSPLKVDQATVNSLAGLLKGSDPLATVHALELLPHVQGRDFGPELAQLLQHPISSIRASAADALARNADGRYSHQLRRMLDDPDPWCVASAIIALCALEKERAVPLVGSWMTDRRLAIRAAVVVGLVRHAGLDGILFAADELKRQLDAPSETERELAASVLGAIGVRTFYTPLLRFLNDLSPRVRRAAVIAAGKLSNPELVPELLPALARRETASEAARVLAEFGPGIESLLGKTLLDPQADVAIRRAIPAVLARTGTREAAHELLRALAVEPSEVRAAVARSLARILRQRTDVSVAQRRVLNAVNLELSEVEELEEIRLELGLPLVDGHAPFPVTTNEDGPSHRGLEGARLLLALAIGEERERTIQRTISLLDLLHPRQRLDVVAENLRSETASLRVNAVEVLDNALPDDVKKRLLPLIETRPQSLPPPSAERREQILSSLITGPRPWLAACAARLVSEKRLSGVSDALVSGLASVVPYVREACAEALIRVAPGEAEERLKVLMDDPAPSVRRIVKASVSTRTSLETTA